MDASDPIDVSVIVACYNEAGHLEDSVRQLVELLDCTRWSYEIIFVEDCSTDDTRDVLERLSGLYAGRNVRLIYHDRNMGRGRTVADGLRAARGTVAGFLDIDLEVHAHYIPSFVHAVLNGADMAIARRDYRVHLPLFYRHVLSRGYVAMVRAVLGLPYYDTEAGYKFFRRDRIVPVLDDVKDERWFWDTEIVARCHLKGHRIVEIPCLFVRRQDKKSTLRVVPDSIAYARNLLRFRGELKRLRRNGGRGNAERTS